MNNAENPKFMARWLKRICRRDRSTKAILAMGRDIHISLSLTAQDLALLRSGEALSKSVCLASWSPSLQEECSYLFLKENPGGTEHPSSSGLELQAEIYFSVR